jgi:hypothetical protein
MKNTTAASQISSINVCGVNWNLFVGINENVVKGAVSLE